MGTEHSTTTAEQMNEEEWESIPISSYTKIKDPYYESRFTIMALKNNPNIEIEKYQLFFNNYSQFEAYKDVYLWRKDKKYIVHPKLLVENHTKEICNTFQSATIFFDRIPIRLFQINDIPIEEGMYILYAAFQGFQQIYLKAGYFQISSEMVCITKEGFVKVWLNKNLSKNHPEIHSLSQNASTSSFVNKLLLIIQKLIDFDGRPTISKFGKKTGLTTNFLLCLQKYAEYFNIKVSSYIHSVRQLCKTRGKIDKLKSSMLKNELKTTSNVNNKTFSGIFPNDIPKMSIISESQNNKVFNLKRRSFIENSSFSTNHPRGEIRKLESNKKVMGSRKPSISFNYHSSNALNTKRSFDSLQGENFTHRSMAEVARNRNAGGEIEARELLEKEKDRIEVQIQNEGRFKKKQKSRETYFTLKEECAIDPEIVEDLLRMRQEVQ